MGARPQATAVVAVCALLLGTLLNVGVAATLCPDDFEEQSRGNGVRFCKKNASPPIISAGLPMMALACSLESCPTMCAVQLLGVRYVVPTLRTNEYGSMGNNCPTGSSFAPPNPYCVELNPVTGNRILGPFKVELVEACLHLFQDYFCLLPHWNESVYDQVLEALESTSASVPPYPRQCLGASPPISCLTDVIGELTARPGGFPTNWQVGVCTCGASPNVDSDSDGVADCSDECPNDPSKTVAGACGCGQPEDSTDSDGDGVPDCADWCPFNSAYTTVPVCGCAGELCTTLPETSAPPTAEPPTTEPPTAEPPTTEPPTTEPPTTEPPTTEPPDYEDDTESDEPGSRLPPLGNIPPWLTPTVTITQPPTEAPTPSPTLSEEEEAAARAAAMQQAITIATASTGGVLLVLVLVALLAAGVVRRAAKKRRLDTDQELHAWQTLESGTGGSGGLEQFSPPSSLPSPPPPSQYAEAVTRVVEGLGSDAASCVDLSGYGLVHYVAMLGDTTALHALVGALANHTSPPPSVMFDLRDVNGNSPLMIACARGHVDLAQRLLAMGANPLAVNALTGEIALHVACRSPPAGATENVAPFVPTPPQTPTTPLIKVRPHSGELSPSAPVDSPFAFTATETQASPPRVVSSDVMALYGDAAQDDAQLALIEMLLDAGGIDAVDEHGRTPLHAAAAAGYAGAIALLLKHGAAVNARDSTGTTPLMLAIKMRHGAAARSLIAWPQLNAMIVDANGMTALHWAAAVGDTTAARELLVSSARGNGQTWTKLVTSAASPDGICPLALAVREGHFEMVRLLLSGGGTGGSDAPVDIPDDLARQLLALARQRGRTGPLLALVQGHCARSAADASPPMPHQHSQPQHSLSSDESTSPPSSMSAMGSPLTDDGRPHTPQSLSSPPQAHAANVAAVLDDDGASDDDEPLMPSAYARVIEALVSGMSGAGSLVSHAALLHMLDGDGLALIHHAARVGDPSAVAFLLNTAAAEGTPLADLRDTRQNTPLHWAAHGGIRRCASLLLSAGALVDAVNAAGETPLHVACRRGQLSVVRLLLHRLSSVADQVNAVDSRGRTPLLVACTGSSVPVSAQAESAAEAELVRLLLLSGADAEIADNDGTTPLLACIRAGKQNAAIALLDRGANAERRDDAGNTALHWAAAMGGERVVAHVLKLRGRRVATRNDVNLRQETALFLAARESHAEIVDMLLAHAASANIADYRGRKPIDVAIDPRVRASLKAAAKAAVAAVAEDI